MSGGTIYTETLVHSAPEQFVNEAPYQLIIVTLDSPEESGPRVTGRIIQNEAKAAGVSIGDHVDFVDLRHGTPYFQKS
jgi:uncharacterized OB-fold protein